MAPSNTAKALVPKLTMTDREFVVEALPDLMTAGFPPEQVSALTVDSLMRRQPEAYKTLVKRIEERSESEKAA